MQKGCFICHSCGKRLEFSAEERTCEVLRGWLTVAQWKGLGAVGNYHFCSFTCLQRWVNTQVTVRLTGACGGSQIVEFVGNWTGRFSTIFKHIE